MLPSDYLETLSQVLKEMEGESTHGLRGWKEHSRSTSSWEVAITQELNHRLTQRGFKSESRKYPHSRKTCDIVSALSRGGEVWLEAKYYYTVWFDDESYTTPQLAYGSATFRGKIRDLVHDCSDKLPLAQPSKLVHVGGLLLGFEIEDCNAVSHLPNPSSAEIDAFLRTEVDSRLPGWSIHRLSAVNGWVRKNPACPQYTFVTKAMILQPS